MLDKVTKWAVFLYALLILTMGLIAYFRVGSWISLLSAMTSGLLLLASSILMFLRKPIGLKLATALTAMMTVVFAVRYFASDRLFPALMSVLGGAMLIFLLLHLARWRER